MNLQSIIEAILNEEVALTKGSQRVMSDKNLVANLADSIRDDARSHPSAFPAGFNRTCQKTPDPQLAQWFLENIDRIEKEGYDGIVYSRDGVNSDWIVRRYIAGSHNWEDLTGVMNMNLCDWYLLKNRNMLDPNHKDLPKFGSVRDVGYYMTTHYKDKLEKLRDASKNAARNKMAKSVKLVDNDDYRIYTTLNRAAGCALGLGTQWCTANSNYAGHFHSYSKNAMLFQVFPYVKEKDKEGNLVNVKDEDGKKEMNEVEKYQFDAGGPSFMDVTDRPAKADDIRKKFPYLYTDLASALKEKKPAMEKAFADLSADPTLQGEDFKIKTYEIDDEIKKLHKFVDRGYFTDEVRKKDKVEKDDAGQEQPQLGPPAEPQAPQEQPQMESIKELARMMIEGRLNEFAPAGTPPSQPPKLPPKEPDDHWGDEDDSEEDHPRNYFYLTMSHIKVIKSMYKSIGDPDPVYGVNDKEEIARTTEQYKAIPKIKQLADIFENSGVGAGLKFYLTLPQSVKESLWYSWDGHGLNVEQDCKKFGLNYDLDLDEDSELDVDAGADATGGDLGSMGGGAGPSGGGKYPPGTAPSMPESFNNKGTEIMEEIDKDVAAMLKSLKKYDRLVESCAPVLMARPKPYVAETKEVEEEDIEEDIEEAKDIEEEDELDEEVKVTFGKYNEPRKSEKTDYGSKHIGGASQKQGDQRGAKANVSTKDKPVLPVVGSGKKNVAEEGNPWEKLGSDKKEEKKDGEKSATSKGGEVTKTKTGLTHKGTYGSDKAKDKVEEGADPEVLEWMKRFASLGNMKGYGR